MSGVVGLVDVDSKPGYPNYALMRISTWEKGRGHRVALSRHRISARHHRVRREFELEFPRSETTRNWVSVVFDWHRPDAVALGAVLPGDVYYGGPGFNPGWSNLIRPIEWSRPDYELYGETETAIGFMNRGCFRKCDFCNVSKLEGPITPERYQPPWELVPDGFHNFLALDNEFAHYPIEQQREIIGWFRSAGVRYCLTQGYDLRILAGPEGQALASNLAANKPHADDFARRHLFCAWDYIGNEPAIRKGIERLRAAGFRTGNGSEISVYCLSGQRTSHAEDLHRVRVLWGELGVFPFVMKFNNRHDDPWLNKFARDVNLKPILKGMDWTSYPTELQPKEGTP